MPRTFEVSNDLRKRVVDDRNEGLSYRKLAEKYKLSVSGVRKICMKYEEYGQVENIEGRGRKRKTTVRYDKLIIREAKKKPTVSSREIAETLNLSVSTKTIRRRLNESGLLSRLQRKKPFISEKNKAKRIKFAKEHLNKGLDFWENILWSDESKFELFGTKGRKRVWRKPGEALKGSNLKTTIKHGGGSVMVWGCFSSAGVGEIALITGKMTGAIYVDLLQNNLQKSVHKLGLSRRYVFQQDNDPKHTSSIAKNFFKEKKLRVLEWPPQSPDLNPIENLWSIVDNKLKITERTNKNSFFRMLCNEWNKIDVQTTKKLVESMPRRLKAVLDAKGGSTKY